MFHHFNAQATIFTYECVDMCWYEVHGINGPQVAPIKPEKHFNQPYKAQYIQSKILVTGQMNVRDMARNLWGTTLSQVGMVNGQWDYNVKGTFQGFQLI